MRRIFLLLLTLSILSPAIRSQQSVHQQLDHVFLLEQRGQYDEAIRKLRSLVDAHSDAGIAEMGRAWTLLAVAYEDQGHYQNAQTAFEQALRLFSGDSERLGDYASTLDLFAGLTNLTQGPEIAAKIVTKALKIHERLQDHRAIAMDYLNLAGEEIQTKHVRSAKKRLQQAVFEATLATNFAENDSVVLSDTQGWIANVTGDIKAELAAYLHSMELRRHGQPGDCPPMGWAYLFLGNAYADNKEWDQALTNMRQGLDILTRAIGRGNPQYFAGEALLAKVLDRKGMHDEASHLRKHAENSMKELHRDECSGCTVSVAGLR
jgi:tetratricopeptide (TPR) repeat protein